MNIYSGGGRRDGCAFPCGLCALDLEDACPAPQGGIHTHAEPGGGHWGAGFAGPRWGGGQRQFRLATGVSFPAAAFACYFWGAQGQAGSPLLTADASCAAAVLAYVTAAFKDGEQCLWRGQQHCYSTLFSP